LPKKLVLLSDGTGNSAAKLFKTNVWRLYQALDLSDATGQAAFYNDGVGTSSFKPLAILGGAFGWGLKRNVIDIYSFLCRNYEPGDEIYCFGFSRGAFTVRVLTGVILTQGLVRASDGRELRSLAKEAFREYRREHYHAALKLDVLGRAIRDVFVGRKDYGKRREGHHKPAITFLGLWDTVAAYGLPVDELTRAWNWIFPLSVPDREPRPQVHRICHALAIDDERNTFHPVLFNEENIQGQTQHEVKIHDEKVTQVWFAGMHSDVGGGYPDDGLAYVPLDWMMSIVENMTAPHALTFKPAERAEVRSSALKFGKMYDSRRGLGGFYRYLPRKMSALTNDIANPKNRVVIARPKIHESVIERICRGTDRYAPIVLPSRYAVVKENGDIVDQPQPLEDQTQSQSRANLQENIWNRVWWKRGAYFSSIIVALALLAFPLYREATRVCEGRLCFISPLIVWVGAFLPSFAGTWLDAYRTHPAAFSVLLGIFAGLLAIGSTLQGRICDGMKRLWEPICGAPHTIVKVAPPPSGFPYAFRTSAPYQLVFRVIKQFVLPLVFGVAAAAVILQLAGRTVFNVMSSGGFVCPDTATPRFDTASLCWDSGFDTEEGRRYSIAIEVSGQKWRDRTIPATLGGVRPENVSLAQYSFVLLRRVLREPWFKPIAAIGATSNDLYPVAPNDGSKPTQDTTRFTAEITARRSGRVYIFVNDAILPVPNAMQYFYHNNHGLAEIKIKPIEPTNQ
jgi:hypothetical protein